MGIIVTRGPTLRAALKQVFIDYYTGLSADELEEVETTMRPEYRERSSRAAAPDGRARIVADIKSSSKYGEATTHWKKLMDRIDRGLGDPCPVLLIGIEADRLHR